MVALTDVTKLIDSKHDHSLRLPIKGRAYNRGDKSFLGTTRIIGACDDNGIRKEFVITPEPPWNPFLLLPLPWPFYSTNPYPAFLPDTCTLRSIPFSKWICPLKSVMCARPTLWQMENGCLNRGRACAYMRVKNEPGEMCILISGMVDWQSSLLGIQMGNLSGKKLKRIYNFARAENSWRIEKI